MSNKFFYANDERENDNSKNMNYQLLMNTYPLHYSRNHAA